MLRQELDQVSWRLKHVNKVISWKVYLWWNSIYTNKLLCLLSEHLIQFSYLVVSNLLQCQGLQHGQASLSITNSWILLKLISTKSVMPSNHLILCCPLLLLPSIFSSIRVFSNKSALHIRWPKYWSFHFNISPSNEHSGLISFRMDCPVKTQRGRLGGGLRRRLRGRDICIHVANSHCFIAETNTTL